MSHPIKRASNKAEQRAIDRVRRICLSFPSATEKLAWGEPTFRAGKIFAMMDTHHHGANHVAVVVPAELGVQETLVKADPSRYFVPPYVGVKGWIGVRIDESPDWGALKELLQDAYRLIAPEPKRRRPGAKRRRLTSQKR
ncbi:MAG TPA: MmcQ/YjbR family DNA-binding protein [Myxococcales bacterium]